MDEMKLRLSTKFMRNTVAKIISKAIFKKCGIRPDCTLNELSIEMTDGKVRFHINADGEISQRDLFKLTDLVDKLD